MVDTRDTERPPLCCQATSMPLGKATRANLRFTAWETFAKDTLLPGAMNAFILTPSTDGDNRLRSDFSLNGKHSVFVVVPDRYIIWQKLRKLRSMAYSGTNQITLKGTAR